jgi:hypothetical protein
MATNSNVAELADRRSNDLEVVLPRGRRSGRLRVDVTDRRSGRVACTAATSANALDVFNHLLAYERNAA